MGKYLYYRPLLEPRLFHVWRLPSGSIRAVEIQDFKQSVRYKDTRFSTIVFVFVISDRTSQKILLYDQNLKFSNAFYLTLS
jgi:hypothetical protein